MIEEPEKRTEPQEMTLAQMRARALAAEGTKGLVCSECGCSDFRVYYTRQKEHVVMRRKFCRFCGHEITTYERIV